MKKILCVVIILFLFSCNKKENKVNVSKSEYTEVVVSKEKLSKIKDVNYTAYYKEAKEYCKKNNLNQNKFILIDLGIHSGLKRFFIYDFNKNEVLNSFMVSHGCGNNKWGGTSSKDNPLISK